MTQHQRNTLLLQLKNKNLKLLNMNRIYKRGETVTDIKGEKHVIAGSSRNFTNNKIVYTSDKTHELQDSDIAGEYVDAPVAPVAPVETPAPAPAETPAKGKGKAGKTETPAPAEDDRLAVLQAMTREQIVQLIAEKSFDIEVKETDTAETLTIAVCDLLNIPTI